MKIHLFLVPLLCFLMVQGCASEVQQPTSKSTVQPEPTVSPVPTVQESSPEQESQPASIETYFDSCTIEGRKFKLHMVNEQLLNVTNALGDTILTDTLDDGYPEFQDFDGDGKKDIRYFYFSNVPDVQELFLYHSKNQNFIKVKDFADYPAPIRIGQTPYYYSYHRSGCADIDWDSDLFHLKNYETIHLGNITGLGCEDSPQGVFIYKIVKTKPIEIEKHPIEVIDQYEDYKWGFIKAYWNKHYKKFLP